jgi:hypothetical protein
MNSVIATGKSCWGARGKSAAQSLGGVFAVLLLCLPAFSQGSYGRILGTVSDQSGGVVSGATVSVIDTERGVTRTLTTDEAGAYNAPNLTPGNYTIRVEAKGFKRIERQSVGLEVGHEIRVDLIVQPGEQNQTVTVTESVPLVETTNATMGGTLENADIIDLPLNGRDYQNLLALRPGVQLYPGGGPWTQSANGARPDESVWMVDGVINVNPFDARPIENMPSPFTDGATILPIDAIQEFNLMENPKAEYGWKTGAVVNVGIKSGTNTLHGSAYAFYRTEDLDARNYFNVKPFSDGSCALSSTFPAFCNQTPAQLRQYGGTVGGPIKKDKLFFFAGYEGLSSVISVPFAIPQPATSSLANVGTIGPAGDPANSMVDAINAVGAASLSTVSLKLVCPNAVNATFPFVGPCTGGLTPQTGTSTNFLSAFPIINKSRNGIGKIDYHLNDKNLISGSLFVSRYDAVGEDRPFTNAAFEDTSPIRVWSNVDSWVYTPNSNVVNEMRFGYDRMSFDFVNVDINKPADGITYPINTGISIIGGMPIVRVGRFHAGGADMLGTNFNRPQFNDGNPYYDFQDSISYLKGKHAIKFGGEFAHLEADTATFNNGRGQIVFNGGQCPSVSGSTALEDFFCGAPSSGIVEVGDPHRSATWMVTAGYIQDDFRATPKLMINLGMRYEYFSPMHMRNNLWASFEPNQGLVQQGFGGLGNLWSGDHTGFEPRLGFAWDVNGKGTTVVRAGASLIRSSWPLNTFMSPVGLQNDNSAQPAAVPTGANLVCTNSGISCPATPGGTNSLGVSNINGPQLCWDPALPSCPGGLTTVFPTTALTCGTGATSFSNTGTAIGTDPGPCDVMGVNQNLRTPFVVNYNLGITHQIGSNLSVEVEYVGNRSFRLLNWADANQSQLGAAWCLNTLTAAQLADACGSGPANARVPLACIATQTCGNNSQATQEARPFYTKYPYLGFINQITNRSYSRYNSLQVSVTKRASHGLSGTIGYTFAHGLDNGSLNRFGNLPQDSNHPEFEYGNSDTDVRHRLTFTVTYNIPGIKGFGQVLEGWQLNSIVTYQTAQPWIAFDSGDNISGTGENTDRWNISGSPLDFPSGKISVPQCTSQRLTSGTLLPFDANSTVDPATNSAVPDVACIVVNPYGGVTTPATAAQVAGCTGAATSASTLQSFGCYPSANGKSFITPPALGQFGNMGKNIFRDSGFQNWDMSVFKNFRFKERFGVQARLEVFNILNHPVIANPWGSGSWLNSGNSLGGNNLGAPGSTPDVGYGNPLIGSGSSRDVQLGLKVTF